MLGIICSGSRMSFDKDCARYGFKSIGPKRLLKTQISEKKAKFLMKKKSVTNFSRFIECEELSRQCVRLNEVFRNFLWHYKVISVTPKRFLKTKICEKKATFPVKKISWSFFTRSIEHEKCQGSINRGLEGLLTSIVQDMVSILKDLICCWKHKFMKKGKVSHEKKL